MSKPTPPTYRTTNWRFYDAALKQRGSLQIWFDPATVWLAEPSCKRGRSATFTDAAIQACLTLQALFGLPLRQTTGLVAGLLVLAGLDWPVPETSTLSRRQKGLKVAIPYRASTGALHLLIDSTGIKAEGEGEWFAKKHGPSKPRQWRKVHLGIDAETLEIRAIEVTGSRVGDAPMLPDLPDQIPADQPISKVSADGAHDTRGCHAAIHCPGSGLPANHERGRTRCLRRHSDPSQWQAMAGEHAWSTVQKRNPSRDTPPWPRISRELGTDFARSWARVSRHRGQPFRGFGQAGRRLHGVRLDRFGQAVS